MLEIKSREFGEDKECENVRDREEWKPEKDRDTTDREWCVKIPGKDESSVLVKDKLL